MRKPVMHRKGWFKHGLCGAVLCNGNSTVDDKQVTCLDCIMKLEEICMADTKTGAIQKIKGGKFSDLQKTE